jgi:protein MpaA
MNLKKVCKRKQIIIEKIGFLNKYPKYKIVIEPKNHKKTACFSAGIHGEEIAGPLAIIDFIKEIKKPKYTKIIILPVAAPEAFDKKTRSIKGQENINRLFCNNSKKENKILISAIEKEKIDFFHALHEDYEAEDFYMYNFQKNRYEEKIYLKIIKLASKYFKINNAKKIENLPALKGRIINIQDGSFEDKVYRNGAKYSMCTETPMKQRLKKRIKANKEIMKLVINFLEKSVF